MSIEGQLGNSCFMWGKLCSPLALAAMAVRTFNSLCENTFRLSGMGNLVWHMICPYMSRWEVPCAGCSGKKERS